MAADGTILALDVGTVRIGLARASMAARIASPHGVLQNGDNVWEELGDVITKEQVTQLVVGLPRGLDGQETAQTVYARQFAQTLAQHTSLPIELVDEAVTSRQAEAELLARGRHYEKGDIDALAAVYILEDYMHAMEQR